MKFLFFIFTIVFSINVSASPTIIVQDRWTHFELNEEQKNKILPRVFTFDSLEFDVNESEAFAIDYDESNPSNSKFNYRLNAKLWEADIAKQGANKIDGKLYYRFFLMVDKQQDTALLLLTEVTKIDDYLITFTGLPMTYDGKRVNSEKLINMLKKGNNLRVGMITDSSLLTKTEFSLKGLTKLLNRVEQMY